MTMPVALLSRGAHSSTAQQLQAGKSRCVRACVRARMRGEPVDPVALLHPSYRRDRHS